MNLATLLAHSSLIPGGRHFFSQVHMVASGNVIRRNATSTELKSATNQVLFQELDSDPATHLRGTLVSPQAFAGQQQVTDAAVNWVADAYWQNASGNPITEFRTRWTVPQPPSTQTNQLIYLFNGMEPDEQNPGILQPVLQWGVSPSGGGGFWSVATYYVAAEGPAFSTEAILVNPGDTLDGVIRLDSQDANGFNYIAQFAGMPATALRVSSAHELVWCYEALESYGASADNSYYPASPETAFTAINVQTATGNPALSWTPETGGSNNGQRVGGINNSPTFGEVDIFYR
ncbi:MAG TPA: hypothetical protein VGI60_15085 [Chthoniobacterales bacterium]|jgi:hypothetical protein